MVRMSGLGRDKSSGSWSARKAIPVAIRAAYAAAYGPGWEVKFRRPAALSEREARAEHASWLSDVEARISVIASEVQGRGVDLSHRQAHALAGLWYRWKTDQHAEDPGAPGKWADDIRKLVANLGELAVAVRSQPSAASVSAPTDLHQPGLRFVDLLGQLTTTQNLVLERIAAAADVARFLAREHLALTSMGRRRFIGALMDEIVAANALLHRRAEGDYAPDPRPAKFPEWRAPISVTAGAASSGELGPMALYREWAKANEQRTSASTRNRWITVFRDLERFTNGRDVGGLTEADALAWRAELRGADRTEKTVNFQYIAAAKAVFGWAARPKTDDGGALLTVNPFANFRMGARNGARKVVKLRERSFRLEEMRIILPAAKAVSAPANGLARAKRWAPWLLAYTGARPGEICQLRKQDLRRIQDRWALRLTPEAGTIKDREARIVPVHKHLLALGLVAFLEAADEGPLFFDPTALRRTTPDDPANPRRYPHEKVANNLASWIRELGVTDPGIKPNHAWRHTFKTRALVAGIDSVVADYICGHSPKTIGEAYYALEGDAGWPALVRAIDAFPEYLVSARASASSGAG
jgi:integrase